MTTTIQAAVEDLYPTRQNNSQVIPRRDPVVQGTADQGPFDAGTLRSFDEKGYLSIDQLITTEDLQLFKDCLLYTSPSPRDS